MPVAPVEKAVWSDTFCGWGAPDNRRMPAHVLLQRAEVQTLPGSGSTVVRWSLVNAGDRDALVTAWCAWCATADPATVRADEPPRAPAGSVFSQGALRLRRGERFTRTDPAAAFAGREDTGDAGVPCFVVSVEYTDDTRAARRMHAVQVLRPAEPPQHCHFASLTP